MYKLVLIPVVLLLSITSSGCSLMESENNLPIEMIAFNSLTDGERDLIPVSPKDSSVKKVTIHGDIEPFIDNDYDKNEVYAVTFNHTGSGSSGNLIVFVDLDQKTIVGKSHEENNIVAMIKGKIKRNQTTKETIKEWLGEPDAVRVANSIDTVPDHAEMWRYDFSEEGYKFDGSDMEVDKEGLLKGDMQAQLLVQWNHRADGILKVVYYSIFFEDNGELYQYRLSPYGTEDKLKFE